MDKLLIKGGRIVTAVDDYVGDVLLEGGRIEAIGRSLDVADAVVHDAAGLLVMPGGIDAHVHMETPMAYGIETCDSFETGTKSAAFGGTTTIVDFAQQFKGEGPKEALDRRLAAAEPQCCIDYGFHVILTDVSPSALSELPDLILLDMSLPGMDGFAVVKKVKADQRTGRIPVIALTAHAMKGDREKTLQAGCDDYLPKPVDPDGIIEKMEEWIGKC